MRKKHNKQQIIELLELPFFDLLYQAATIHRTNFKANEIQTSALLSVKSGSCPEDCAYCPQSASHNSEVEKQKTMAIDGVIKSAKHALKQGSSRFCMGAAWAHPTDKNLELIIEMIKKVKNLGMQTCVTLGSLTQDQAIKLKNAGLDYYNHNIDTSAEYYDKIITTRTFADRIKTLEFVQNAKINVCAGGILGMGESVADRASMLNQLASLSPQPKSVPLNMLVQVKGTPLYGIDKIDMFDFIRTVAVARIIMPTSYIRLSAGRDLMSEQTQALCFFAGANSVFYGDKLLTTDNQSTEKDQELFKKLNLTMQQKQCHSTKIR
ncbi:MAG: biotin synthase BioB [Gammaproteobacteria bacterium]|nr:MAG: biotin synthase BioB [Gammaproteobacteria bacterium]